MSASTQIENILAQFSNFTKKPVKFLTVQNEVKDDVKYLIKSLYDFTKSQEEVTKKKSSNVLPELIVNDFDEEQIWQQIELQNLHKWDQLVWDVANGMSAKSDLVFPVEFKGSEEDSSDEGEEVVSDEKDFEAEKETEVTNTTKAKSLKSKKSPNEKEVSKENKQKKSTNKVSKGKSSIVDDEFFKLQEMEKFLVNEEKKGSKTLKEDSDEESIYLFEDIDDSEPGSDAEEGGQDVMYHDFFDRDDNDEGDNINTDDETTLGENNDEIDDDNEDYDENEDQSEAEVATPKAAKKNKKKVTFAGMSDSDDNSTDNEGKDKTHEPNETAPPNSNEKKSQFELRQERLKNQIAKMENKILTDAPWQLKGEVDATKRPQNSLLQEVVDFDLTARPAPIITEQTTVTLEDIINQRIKDKAWDDVEKKEKPVDDQLSFRKTVVLDQAKSKLSLAQVYEAEYLKQKQSASGEVEEEEEPEEHKQIRESMSKLFAKLDALTHYHYTPRAPQPDVKIVSNTPAISMEEVAPVATSDAALLAPEEVKKKRRGELMSKEERTVTDKNRERRKKKKLQRTKGKVSKVTEHRNTKKAVESSNDKSLKRSKAFFQQLNDETTSLIKLTKNKRNVKNKGQ